MTWKRIDRWSGGYVRQRFDAGGRPRGRPVYVIEREIQGVRFHVSTRCSDLERAVRHLARFELDPAGYTPAGKEARVAEVRLTEQLVDDYHAHQLQKQLTREWADTMARLLGDWTEVIGHLDLRRVSVQELKSALEGWPKRKAARIKALKGFFRWLRTERGLVTHAQDATLDLRVPVGRPERWTRRKVVPVDDVQAVLRELDRPVEADVEGDRGEKRVRRRLELRGLLRDMLHLLTATAWHLSEVRRFVFLGELVRVPRARPGAPIAVLLTRHKGGDITRTPLLYEEHVEVAERLLARRRVPGFRWPKSMSALREMREACAAADVPRFTLGRMRHSVLTWAHERGADMAKLREFAHHKSEATTRAFYVDAAVPVNSIPVVRMLPARGLQVVADDAVRERALDERLGKMTPEELRALLAGLPQEVVTTALDGQKEQAVAEAPEPAHIGSARGPRRLQR